MIKDEVKEESEAEDDKFEIECLARKIEEVEYAKIKKPEMYSKAVAELKGKAKVISSIADIKKKRQDLDDKDA
jgi:hypothetical protein